MMASRTETVVGSVERITYRNDESGYVVARLRPENQPANVVTIVGVLPGVFEGERIEAKGEWQKHRKFGMQYHVSDFKSLDPVTIPGIRKYLASGLIKGIGPVYAERIVKKFGDQTLDILDKQTNRIREVPGIGSKRAELIKDAWKSQRQIREVMIFLASQGISASYAVRIYKSYGYKSLSVLRENPYQLADDIFGVGFLTADKIAKQIGVGSTEPARLESGLKYLLNQATDKGHLYLPEEELIKSASLLLEVSESDLVPVLDSLVRVGHLVKESENIFLPAFFNAENELAEMLMRLMNAPPITFDVAVARQFLSDPQGSDGPQFNQKQKSAVERSLKHKILVITGGPGTGKTTLVRGILQLFSHLEQKILLASPTGRASKRLSETTGRQALTIHRLLEFDGKSRSFNRNARNQLQCDGLILDEMSMVDTVLARNLLSAIPINARLVMVGDADQLPSVGAGNVLRDIIESGAVPTVQLDEVFRQEADSQIVMNAHRINSGLMPDLSRKDPPTRDGERAAKAATLPKDDFGDLLFAKIEEPEQGADIIINLCAEKLPARYGYDPMKDIQILTPMYRGVLGADNLNRLLQSSLNPTGQSVKRGNQELRRGDRVMQIRNNYDKSVFNGDVGIVKSIRPEDEKLSVDFGPIVNYDYTDLDELALAYAITVHKSQGSEFRVVIMPLVTQHYLMLQRNLLYTAVTRAKELIILVGSKKALAMAIKNNYVQKRNTRLMERLVQNSRGVSGS